MKLEDVLEVLGVADAELILDAAEALADHDAKAALMAVERLSASGRDLTQFMRELAAHLRHLFVVQTLGDVPESFAVTAEHTDRLQSQAERISQAEVLRAIDLLAAALSAVKDGSDPRIQLEIALLKATQPQSDGSLQALMARVERLEQSAGGARAPRGRALRRRPRWPPSRSAGASPRRPPPRRRRARRQRLPSARPRAPKPRPRRPSCPRRWRSRSPSPSQSRSPIPRPPRRSTSTSCAPSGPRPSRPCARENGMVGALLADARPVELDGRAPHRRLRRGRHLLEEEGGGQPRAARHRAARPHRATRSSWSTSCATARASRGRPIQDLSGLSEDELLERLTQDFGATEVLDHEE